MSEEDENESRRVIYRPGPVEWSLDITCEKCGWPWRLRGVSETQSVHIEKTVQCPNCGQKFTLWIHHE